MNNLFEHRRVYHLLYEYVRGEASPAEEARVEKHIAGCSRCASELDELQKGFDKIPVTTRNPAEEQPDAFWRQFLNDVDLRIDQSSANHKPSILEELDLLISWLVARQRWVIGVGGVVAAAVIAVLFLTPANVPKQVQPQQEVAATAQPVPDPVQVSARAGDYFRKSQALLVGISNMRVENDQPIDLSAEQQLSQQLVHEASYLKQQPLDVRSARVVTDVEKILVQLANAREGMKMRNMEFIRAGIHQDNLLFKVRMAESMFDSSYAHAAVIISGGK